VKAHSASMGLAWWVAALTVSLAGCSSSGGGIAGGGATGGGGGASGSGGNGTGGTSASGGGSPMCNFGDTQCSGTSVQNCDLNGQWGPPTACQFVCTSGACGGTCKPGDTKCKYPGTVTCGADGEWGATATACEFGCANGTCKTGCNAGEFHCAGNTVQQCNPGPPSSWTSTSTVCNAASGQKCDATTGTCVALTPIGSTTPTGEYYQYAVFKTTDSAFLGGYDVTSSGDYLYVNRGSQNLDVYKVTLTDSDGDGKLEPNQHPNNPDETGPVETRTIELVKTYTKGSDGVPLGPASTSSLYAKSNNEIFMLGPSHNGMISQFVFGSGSSSTAEQPAATTPPMSHLGFGYGENTWFGSNEGARRVYSYDAASKAWVAEFAYPDLAGTHMDGIDAVVSPKTGEQFVYVTDMTSDFIGQYKRDDSGGWVQANLFKYSDATSSAIEGFGFGTLNHFWAASGTFLYELGGGDIQEDLQPCADGKQACGAGLPACANGGFCKAGCCQTIR